MRDDDWYKLRPHQAASPPRQPKAGEEVVEGRQDRIPNEAHGIRGETAERPGPEGWQAAERESAGRSFKGAAVRGEESTARTMSRASHEERPLQVSRRPEHGPENARGPRAEPSRAL